MGKAMCLYDRYHEVLQLMGVIVLADLHASLYEPGIARNKRRKNWLQLWNGYAMYVSGLSVGPEIVETRSTLNSCCGDSPEDVGKAM